MTTPSPSGPPVRHVLLVLACDDVARAKAFYVQAFGWQVEVDLPVYVEMEVPTGLRVGLYARDLYVSNTGEPAGASPRAGTTACELYLRVDDPHPALKRLLAAGGRLLAPVAPRRWGDEAGYVADPEGNVVAVARPLEQEAQQPAETSGARVSAEIRWFWTQEPASVRRWFAAQEHHGVEAGGGGQVRSDTYVCDPLQPSLGVKIRGGGGLEIKGLVAERPGAPLSSVFAGPVQVWAKWPSQLSLPSGGTRLEVHKRRWLRKLAVEGGRVREIPLGADEKPRAAAGTLPRAGCNVELTEVSLAAGATAWTLGFEAFGALDEVEACLRAATEELTRRRPPALTGGSLASYPAWLARQL